MAYKRSRKNSLSGKAVSDLKGDGFIQELMVRYGITVVLYLGLFFSTLISWIGLPVSNMAPFWSVIVVFVWSVRWPETLPAALIFIVGLLTDIVTGAPLGVYAFSLLTMAFLGRLQQRFLLAQHFMAVWIDFAVLSFLFVFLVGGLSLIAFEQYHAMMAIIWGSLKSWVALVLMFPVISMAMNLLISFAKEHNERF